MEITTPAESTATLPAWNNTTEYSALNAPDFLADFTKLESMIAAIETLNRTLAPQMAAGEITESDRPAFLAALRELSLKCLAAYEISYNLQTYINCEISLDSKNAVAQKLSSRVQKVHADLASTATPLDLYLVRCSDEMFEAYLNDPSTASERFYRAEERKKKDLMLSEEQERLLLQMRQFGCTAWGDLYDAISGTMRVNLPGKGEVGLAQASVALRAADENQRREAYRGIQAAWKVFEEPAAAILNNLAGYRLEEYRQRSSKRPVGFLDYPLMQSRIERETLDAMFAAIEEQVALVQRGLALMAKCFGKRVLEPWDFLAPAPGKNNNDKFDWPTATRLVTEAFADLDPKMGEFVTMMLANGWVDARVLPNKRPGAYCTGFAKSRTPRVFQTFVGSYKETSTLAHELGHAWHSWVMRDLPITQSHYPMTLAETASIFAETALADHVYETGGADLRFEVAFAEVSHAMVLLANIPARFEFERSFYEARQNGTLTAAELCELTEKAWRKYFGEQISEVEQQYWMTKLHFSIADVSFYNYPYTFGYLFSLGIYSQREALGAEFSARYVNLLRDTGGMTAEELIQKHLAADIRKPDFWRQSLRVVEGKIAALEKLMEN